MDVIIEGTGWTKHEEGLLGNLEQLHRGGAVWAETWRESSSREKWGRMKDRRSNVSNGLEGEPWINTSVCVERWKAGYWEPQELSLERKLGLMRKAIIYLTKALSSIPPGLWGSSKSCSPKILGNTWEIRYSQETHFPTHLPLPPLQQSSSTTF